MKKILFDLYYSRKQADFLYNNFNEVPRTILDVNGKMVRYTEMVECGKECTSLWDDVEFVGHAFDLVADEIFGKSSLWIENDNYKKR